MDKFEVSGGDETWHIIETSSGGGLMTAPYDEHGYAGQELIEQACRLMNRIYEHPEDFDD